MLVCFACKFNTCECHLNSTKFGKPQDTTKLWRWLSGSLLVEIIFTAQLGIFFLKLMISLCSRLSLILNLLEGCIPYSDEFARKILASQFANSHFFQDRSYASFWPWILINFSGNMSAHQKVGAGKSCNMRLRSIITEGQESNGRFIDVGNRAGQQSVCVMICGCETSCLLLDFS